MSTEREHSKTPWAIWQSGGGFAFIMSGLNRVARIEDQKLPHNEARANREFIVTACNNHDAMLAALEATSAKLEEYRKTGYMTGWDAAAKQAREAIAQAKGGVQS